MPFQVDSHFAMRTMACPTLLSPVPSFSRPTLHVQQSMNTKQIIPVLYAYFFWEGILLSPPKIIIPFYK